MKVTRKKAEKWNFPCYGRSTYGAVVFFTADKQGTCIGD